MHLDFGNVLNATSNIVPSATINHRQFERNACLAAVNATYDSLYLRNPEYFARHSDGSRPFLSLPGCNALCGDRWGPYTDSGPRLLDWIIPSIVLIANLHFVPIGRRRYMMIAHFVGDPIDTMYRQIEIVEEWTENLRKAKIKISKLPELAKLERAENVATILSAASRLLDLQQPSHLHHKIIQWLIFKDNIHFKTRYAILQKAASTLRLSRSHDSRRTGVAIFLYIFQFVVVFVYRIGGGPNPSGGRVSPAMMLSWFIPVVMLSNVIGDYGSWRQARDTIRTFLNEVYGGSRSVPVRSRDLDAQRSCWGTFNAQFSELACSGSVRHESSTSASRKLTLILISIFPVALACATAFRVDFTGPTWFSCRAVTVLTSAGGWLLSWILTTLATKYIHRDHRWTFIFFKDLLIGSLNLAFIFLSTAGLFNSCYCISGALFRGESKAFVDLNPVSIYPDNNVVYRWTVGIGLFLQMLVVPVLVLWAQRKGFRTIWWKVPDND
jgi:hypothetical protein